MMDGELRQELETLILATLPKILFIAEVDSVDEDKQTCVVKPVDGRPEYTADLKAVTDGELDGDWMIPTKGSQVICALLDNGQRCVIVDGTQSTLKHIKTDKFDVDADDVEIDAKVVMNGGDNGGMVVIGDLIKKLNAIENDLNVMKGIWAGCVPVATDGGAAIKSAFATYATDLFVPTQKVELENTDVKH